MRILLSSVFGPYGVDDAYGRKENIMELFHNQVTREQGLFSLRFNHKSFGLYFIAENITAPTAVLDFPSEQRFVSEIKKGYDYVGISFIVPNFIKAKRMAELVRLHAPESKIVLGGHGTMIPNIEQMIEHDHICRGEGVKWFRKLLGEEPDRPFKHPALPSAFGKRIVGIPLRSDAAVLVPGVGCPNACRFCSTSHFFNKEYTPYFDTGQEMFDVCQQVERETGCDEFFVMDENFLKRPERAREMVRLMEEHDKPYRFGIFSSAEAITDVGVEFLARLGVQFLWVGVESEREVYEKNRGVDIRAMIQDLRDHGIGVLASGILFLEHHDPQTVWDDIRFMVSLGSDFVQFMQLGPLPGTQLYADYDEKGMLRKDIPFEEWHGQHRIWFDHPNFTQEETERVLREALQHDYDVQGPSLVRLCDTIVRGVNTLGQYSDPWMARRRDALRSLAASYRPLLDVARRYAHNAAARSLAERVAAKYEAELGRSSIMAVVRSKLARVFAWRENRRVQTGTALRQPAAKRTKYRMSARDLVAGQLAGRSVASLLHLDVKWSESLVYVNLEGILDKVNSKALVMKIRSYLKKEQGELVLRFDQLAAVEHEALCRLLVKLKKHHHRVKIVFREEAEAVRAALASMPDDLVRLFMEAQPAPV